MKATLFLFVFNLYSGILFHQEMYSEMQNVK